MLIDGHSFRKDMCNICVENLLRQLIQLCLSVSVIILVALTHSKKYQENQQSPLFKPRDELGQQLFSSNQCLEINMKEILITIVLKLSSYGKSYWIVALMEIYYSPQLDLPIFSVECNMEPTS